MIAKNETSGPYFADGHAVVSVEAKYYAGGGLPNAETTWTVTTSPGSYSPPNWPGFTFGSWRPWWRYYDFEDLPGGKAARLKFLPPKQMRADSTTCASILRRKATRPSTPNRFQCWPKLG